MPAPRAQRVDVVRGAPFSPAICASLIARASRAYPTGPFREHEQVLALGVGLTVGGPGDPERHLRTEDGRAAPCSRAARAKRTTP